MRNRNNQKYEEYKKESRRLMNFCRRMIDKKSEREEYEELEQPQGIPDIKPISKKELDEKIRGFGRAQEGPKYW